MTVLRTIPGRFCRSMEIVSAISIRPMRGRRRHATGAPAPARAQYITFLDSDDLILPTKLARQAAYLQAHPHVDVVLCGWRLLGPDGITVGQRVARLSHCASAGGDPAFGDLWRCCPPGVPVMRKSCFERTAGFDESLLSREEQDFWAQVLLAGCHFAMIKEVLCVFRRHRRELGQRHRPHGAGAAAHAGQGVQR